MVNHLTGVFEDIIWIHCDWGFIIKQSGPALDKDMNYTTEITMCDHTGKWNRSTHYAASGAPKIQCQSEFKNSV